MRIFYLSCLSTWQEPLCTPFLDWTHCLVQGGSISEREVNQKNLEKIFFCIWYASAIPHSGKRFAFLWWWPFEWEMSLLSSHPPVGLSWVVEEKEVVGIYLDLLRKVQKNPKSDDPWEDSKRSLALIESLFLHSILGR